MIFYICFVSVVRVQIKLFIRKIKDSDLNNIIKMIFVFLMISLCLEAKADLKQFQVHSPAIADNFIGTDAMRTINVYLPDDYDKNNQQYPVLYFLGAYSWGPQYAKSFSKMFDEFEKKNQSLDFIVVMIDGDTPLRGSFYVNSKVHGRFADFVLKETLPWVKENFRIKSASKHTAIAGFSMGGTGALRFAADNPSKFGHVYALSPGIMDDNGLNSSYLSNKKAVARYKKLRSDLSKSDNPAQLMETEFKDFQGMALWQNGEDNSNAAFVMAYGGAFAAQGKTVFGPHFSTQQTQEPHWRFGFGNLINQYSNPSVLSKLYSVRVEVGDKDEYKWITEGTLKLKEVSEAQNSKVEVITFDGNHINKLNERIAQSMLPHFQSLL